ncbi:MAG: hypothetical protein DCF19_08675 [Pseudanabaena frigida]|uniref:Uncharacterized protein n=1 Tax=Pseudanabaena frigida TaxID=945775 RepID=A0A2W4Y377_9CYAN|nr:MAG: hypothetical protein DCF19_08675 [Pseudanabaena frigida]
MTAKSLMTQSQLAVQELLEGLIEDKSNLVILPELGLSRVVAQVISVESVANAELRDFYFSCSTIDYSLVQRSQLGIFVKACFEYQGIYHDTAVQQLRDRKKAALLRLAKMPLFYFREPAKGYLCLYSPNSSECLWEGNVYRGTGRIELQTLLLSLI